MTEPATVSPIETAETPSTETPERVYLAAEREGHQAEQARLADLDYVRDFAAKRGARKARKAFMDRVDALRAK